MFNYTAFYKIKKNYQNLQILYQNIDDLRKIYIELNFSINKRTL